MSIFRNQTYKLVTRDDGKWGIKAGLFGRGMVDISTSAPTDRIYVFENPNHQESWCWRDEFTARKAFRFLRNDYDLVLVQTDSSVFKFVKKVLDKFGIIC